MIRMATDVGGTFTDIVWVNEETGEVRADKAQTTPRDVVQGVLDAVAKTRVPADDVSMFVHGSTVATNALIVKGGGTTGLIATKGFRDSLEIRRVNRPDEHIYNIFWRKPEPLVPRRLRLEISARMRFDGEEMEPVVRSEVESAVAAFRAAGVETVAVCLLHAYADPRHELAVRDIVLELWPDVYVSLSHEVAREIREYERVSSTTIDAYVKKPVVGYLRRLRRALVEDVGMGSDPLIANSAGGVSTVETIARAPIQMIASGPAGGAIGAAYLAGRIGLPNLVTADVGGTSYDVSLVVDGKTVLQTEHEVLGYAAKLSSVDVRSVGAGGGSIAWVDDGGLLHVGPKSAGADPGPMCYDKGGEEPTVTDAAVVAGLIDPERFAGGEIKLDADLARKGVERVAADLKLNPLASAEGILTVARNNMANVTRQILVGQGYDPRDFALLSFGGGGGLFASEVARSLDIPTVVVPVHPAAFSAWGMLSADIVGSFARSYVRPIDQLDKAVVQRLFDEMESDATELMSDANIATDAVAVERSVDARYEGQGHEVEVSLDAVALENGLAVTLAERFDELHEIRYGHRMASARETVTFRLRAFGRMKKLRLDELPQSGSDPSAAVMGRRPVYLAGASRDCGVYDRSRLTVGNVIAGPAIVEEPAHVTVVLPGDELRVDRFGNLVITVGA
ncbi:MAG: N-methylhydantoinase [Thermomicrobiales bacterium]|nr:N-methylhydantoinase [Thermomicrobiales bacterium]